MCILAFITHYCRRFPFILISNRDEVLSRLTYPLAVDAETGLLWSVDGVAGGSWLGVHLRSGRLATVTNCRRTPSAPLNPSVAAAVDGSAELPAELWRGAGPLADTLQHTRVVEHPSSSSPTLLYEPPTSRGTIIRDFLVHGHLPGEVCTPAHSSIEVAAQRVSMSLAAPYYAGYNLLTCASLHDSASSFPVRYTTNRNGLEWGEVLPAGTIHCLQNSYMDCWAEPKTNHLRQLFGEALRSTIDVLTHEAVDVAQVASALADHCLNNTDIHDVEALLAGNSLDESQKAELEALMKASDPRAGFTTEEMKKWFSSTADVPIGDGGAAQEERDIQRRIFTPPHDEYGTRVQSVVLVERVPPAPSGEEAALVVNVLQRQAGSTSPQPWSHFRISADGSAQQMLVPT